MSKYEIATAKQKAQRSDAKLLIRSAKSTPTPFSASMSHAFHQGQLYSSNINFNDFFFFWSTFQALDLGQALENKNIT